MPIFSGHVAAGVDDYDIEVVAHPDVTAHTNTVIDARRIRNAGTGNITEDTTAYVDLDTSGIDAGWTINSATLRWYTSSYSTTPKADPEGSTIEMWNGSSWSTIQTVAVDRVVGWESYVLDETERGYINDAGATRFNFQISNSETWGSVRAWTLRSYEHTASNGYSVFLEVDYTEPGVGGRRAASRFIVCS